MIATASNDKFPSTMPIMDYFERWYRPVKLATRTEKTYHQYRVNIRLFGEFLGRPATLGDLQDDLVTAFMGYGMKQRNWSPSTANKAKNHLCALWKYAARKRHGVDVFPDVDSIPLFKKTPLAWTDAEMQRIIAAAARATGQIEGISYRLFWPALLLTCYDTGGRIGAVLALRWCDVDLEGRTVLLTAEHQKQRADQLLDIHADTARALLAMKRPTADGDALVFPWPVHRHTLYNTYRRILKMAGFDAGRRDLFHKLRRTAATETARCGGSAAATELLGHSSGHVTKVYLDPRRLERKTYVNDVPRPKWELAPTIDATTPIRDWLTKFHAATIAVGFNPTFCDDMRYEIGLFIDGQNLRTAADVRSDSAVKFVADLKAAGYAPSTVQGRKQAVAMFLRWLIEKQGMAGEIVDAHSSVITNHGSNRLFDDDEAKGGAA